MGSPADRWGVGKACTPTQCRAPRASGSLALTALASHSFQHLLPGPRPLGREEHGSFSAFCPGVPGVVPPEASLKASPPAKHTGAKRESNSWGKTQGPGSCRQPATHPLGFRTQSSLVNTGMLPSQTSLTSLLHAPLETEAQPLLAHSPECFL